MIFNSSTAPLRSCRPCYISKIRCDRGVPHCQTCTRRGKSSQCVYDRVAYQKPTISEPQRKRQKQEQEGETGDHHIPSKVFEPQSEQYLQHDKSTTEEMPHIIELANEANFKHIAQGISGKGNLASHEIPPKSIVPKVAEETSASEIEDGRRNTEDVGEQPQSLSISQPTKLYAQMIPPSMRRIDTA
ncbi:hypothetical protein N7475_000324 [Penicillium sp. IBT 31633x]|nr:hypothetical protein N7475_000324 [Penicillium sp. IBT 31633x]